MKNLFNLRTLALCLITLWVGSLAHAASAQYFKSKVVVQKPDGTKKVQTVETYLTQDRLRTRTECQQARECVDVIFLGAKQTLYIIDHNKKRVTTITKADMDQLAKTMGPFLKQMMEMQKRMREAQKKKQGQPAAPRGKPGWSFKKVASGVKVGSFTCDRYEIYRDGQKVGEQCVVPYAGLGLDEATVRSLFSQFRKMMESFLTLFKGGMDEVAGDEPPTPWAYLMQGKEPPYPGLPIQQRITTADQTISQMELLESGKRDVPADLFQVPAGYQVTSIGDMMQQMAPQRPPQ